VRATPRHRTTLAGAGMAAGEPRSKYSKPLIVNGFATLNPEIIA
jgi:hypothetical protein